MLAPILITGAAQRAGLALAKHFLQHDQPVIFTYRHKPEGQQQEGVRELLELGATGLSADFQNTDQTLDLISQVQALTPQLRAIIHNASCWHSDQHLAPNQQQPSLEELQKAAALLTELHQVHVQAPYLLNMGLSNLLVNYAQSTQRQADIIHLTDDALRRGSAKHSAYLTSKAGLENLTLSFAQRLAPWVKVNSIAPALLKFNLGDSPEYKQQALKKSLLGIEPGFTVLVQSVNYLLEQNYLTGASLPLNAGRHLK